MKTLMDRQESSGHPTERIGFVLVPFAGEFDDIYSYAIAPALQRSGYQAVRPDDIKTTIPLLTTIVSYIYSASVVIADLSYLNPNVLYELGIAHAFAKPTIIISREKRDLPFDVSGVPFVLYDNIRQLSEKLTLLLKQVPEPLFNPASGIFAEANSRKDVQKLERDLETIRQELRAKEDEIRIIKTANPEGKELLVFREEIRAQLQQIADQVLSRASHETAEAKAIAKQVGQENQALRSMEKDYRRLKQMRLVKPHWAGGEPSVEKDLCYMLMPFGEPWSDAVFTLVRDIVKMSGYRCERGDEDSGRIVMEGVWSGIGRAEYVIADLTGKNANVTYEVGLADVLGKQVILLSQTPSDIPFDFLGIRLITYDNSIGGARKLSEELGRRLRAIVAK